MNKWLLVFCYLFSAWLVQAHQPDVSTTMLVEQKTGSWVLQIRSALTAFEYEVNTNYGKDSFKTPEEFKELVIAHLRKNIVIHFNEKDTIQLKKAFVKLGHETNVVFEVIGVPKTIQSLFVKNSSFKDINRNQSALVILKDGFAKKQFVLNNKNKHRTSLIVAESGDKFITPGNQSIASTDKQESGNSLYIYSSLLATLLIGVVLFFVGKSYKNKTA